MRLFVVVQKNGTYSNIDIEYIMYKNKVDHSIILNAKNTRLLETHGTKELK